MPRSAAEAFLGVHGCDLAAITLQALIFAGDPGYIMRRAASFIVAADC